MNQPTDKIELTDEDVVMLNKTLSELARLKGITEPKETNWTLISFHDDIITATQEYLMALAREMQK
jgi:hypothetical protein